MKKTAQKNVLLSLTLILLACATLAAQQKVKNPIRQSMIALIANPEKFNNTRVATRGFLKFIEGEQITIYLSKDDLYYNNMKNSFVLYFDEKILETQNFSKINGHYVSIIGWFKDTKDYYYSGAIKGITYIESSDDDASIENYRLELEERKKADIKNGE